MDEIERKLIRLWERVKRNIDEALTGTNEDEREWDLFLDRMVAVREGKAPSFDSGWILCGVHQPPHSGTYLTTTAKGAVRVNHYYDYHGTWGYNNDAVAWRPMPEAWRQTE